MNIEEFIKILNDLQLELADIMKELEIYKVHINTAAQVGKPVLNNIENKLTELQAQINSHLRQANIHLFDNYSPSISAGSSTPRYFHSLPPTPPQSVDPLQSQVRFTKQFPLYE